MHKVAASDFYHSRNRVHKPVSMRSRTVVTTVVHDTPTSSGRADLKAVDRLLDSKLPLGELEQERVLLEFEKLQLSSASSNRRVFGGLASALSAFFAWATWSQCVDPFGQQYTGELKAVVPGAGAAAVVLGLQAVACAATAWGMLSQLPRPGELARGCLPAPYQQWLLLTLGSLASLPCTVFWLVAHRRLDVLLGRGLTARWHLLWVPLLPLALSLVCSWVMWTLGNSGRQVAELRKLRYQHKKV
ncbi:hypothetical protein V8C86DRAFT_2629564 [Haematococcus lacustris]